MQIYFFFAELKMYYNLNPERNDDGEGFGQETLIKKLIVHVDRRKKNVVVRMRVNPAQHDKIQTLV